MVSRHESSTALSGLEYVQGTGYTSLCANINCLFSGVVLCAISSEISAYGKLIGSIPVLFLTLR